MDLFGSGRCWVGLSQLAVLQVMDWRSLEMRGSPPLMSLHRRGGDDGGSSLRGQTRYRASSGATKQGGCRPPSPFLFVLLPAPTPSCPTTLLPEDIKRNPKANDNMADENTNPAVEETKVDETPISHPNAARRNSLEKQLAQRPDRAELVESKHPARCCRHRLS